MKYFFVISLTCISALVKAQNIHVKRAFSHAQSQISYMLKEVRLADSAGSQTLVSPRTFEKKQIKMVRSGDWTSGFFPGILWYLYEYSKDRKWLDEAKKYTARIETEKNNTGTHDLGFMIGCSFGNGYRLTGSESYKSVILQAARSLSKRFNPVTGVIRSWDHNKDKWTYPVIIDNMMNLELLFEASRLTGDSSFRKIAIRHANTTLKNHFRPDYSSYHVVDYDPARGVVKSRGTHQGYSDESAWARGQGWALYGFTMCFRETKDHTYLHQAENVASFILSNKNFPSDGVPYWDFNDPAIPNAPRDASAAAVIASALYELASYSTRSSEYIKAANHILNSLSEKYTSPTGQNGGFILTHSTGHKPANSEIDVPLIYADYYYLEALLRYKTLME